jgi:nucleotide-binding universal stress UspA family protein
VNAVKTIKRILYATDFSPASSRALDEAINLAKQNNAELLAVHVIEPIPYVAGDEFAGAEIYTKVEEANERQANSGMAKLMQRLQKAKVKAQSLLLKGSVHDQIVKAAKSKKADMIVIGTHGRTGLSKLFMGSVAGKVVSSATCPVVTVRGK